MACSGCPYAAIKRTAPARNRCGGAARVGGSINCRREANYRSSQYPFSFSYDNRPTQTSCCPTGRSGRRLPHWRMAAPARRRPGPIPAPVCGWSGRSRDWPITRPWNGCSGSVMSARRIRPSSPTCRRSTWLLDEPLAGQCCYRLHRTNGAPAAPTDFEPTLVSMAKGACQQMGGGGGRSSNRDFPFFKIETGPGVVRRRRRLVGPVAGQVGLPAGRPAARRGRAGTDALPAASGRAGALAAILLLRWPGDTLEANAQFRQLIYKHYAARAQRQAARCRRCSATPASPAAAAGSTSATPRTRFR